MSFEPLCKVEATIKNKSESFLKYLFNRKKAAQA
uniref:Uncharacterized protein n=1 Tax=Rhizophora mucronata TaxID=61149 RepID=A0A2P2NLB1_RHIMU